tara:strand:+ start:942 stop:1451 length:510 start_codon:yes stop_codon:yes gene_type:complete
MGFWNELKEKKLKELWKKGHSGSEIANMLGEGATRNSVLGKAFRLKLETRSLTKKSAVKTTEEKTIQPPENKTQKLGRKARFRALLLDKNFEAENPIYDISKLNDQHCRYPNNHPGDANFYFCGRQRFPKQVYCALHIMVCYQAKNEKEEDQITEEDIPQFIEKKIKSA